jgi:hypothetical protein
MKRPYLDRFDRMIIIADPVCEYSRTRMGDYEWQRLKRKIGKTLKLKQTLELLTKLLKK